VTQKIFDNGMFSVYYHGEDMYEINFYDEDLSEGWSTYIDKSELVKWLEAAE